eukprot:g21855.t1
MQAYDTRVTYRYPHLARNPAYGGHIHHRRRRGEQRRLGSRLHVAAASGACQEVQQLIAMGAMVEQSSNGLTPLMRAAMHGNGDTAKALIQANANVDRPDDISKDTALHWAASSGAMSVVKVLLEAGAEGCRQNKYWDTPMHLAARQGCLGCVLTLLLPVGPQGLFLKNMYGRTPLDDASTSVEVAACLAQECRGHVFDHIDKLRLLPGDLAMIICETNEIPFLSSLQASHSVSSKQV